jgi:gluconolactonase
MTPRTTVLLSLLLSALASACGEGDEASSGGALSSSSGTGGASSASGSGGAPSATGSSGSAGASGSGGAAGAKICPSPPFAADPLPANKTAQKIQGGFKFLEGPVWLADRNALLFSDMNFGVPNAPPLNGPASTIHMFTPPSSFEVFLANGGSNGLGLDHNGLILACTHDTRSVSRYDPASKARSLVAAAYMGKKFNSPNDVVERSDGTVYFSDPDYQLSGGTPSELPTAVYRVNPEGAVSLVDTMAKPNGVALSPDETTLYVGAVDGKIRKYAVSADGSTGPAQAFSDVSGPDGMGVDCAGNLYVTGSSGVAVISPAGKKLGTIGGFNGATNVAFGGPERKTLYITAGDALYSIELPIPGYPY